jgi:hypothetical protein
MQSCAPPKSKRQDKVKEFLRRGAAACVNESVPAIFLVTIFARFLAHRQFLAVSRRLYPSCWYAERNQIIKRRTRPFGAQCQVVLARSTSSQWPSISTLAEGLAFSHAALAFKIVRASGVKVTVKVKPDFFQRPRCGPFPLTMGVQTRSCLTLARKARRFARRCGSRGFSGGRAFWFLCRLRRAARQRQNTQD